MSLYLVSICPPIHKSLPNKNFCANAALVMITCSCASAKYLSSVMRTGGSTRFTRIHITGRVSTLGITVHAYFL